MSMGQAPALIDTHAHLDSRQFDGDREEVIERARQAGVACIINAGASLPSSEAAVALAEAHSFIFAAVGVHPHDAKTVDAAALARLRELAAHPRVVAIGEIGLDYFRDLSPRPDQRAAFQRQLELAGELGKPVIIHDRDAHQETLEALQPFTAGHARPWGVMHCFSGSLEMARQLVALGLLIGVDGPVTFHNARKLPEIVTSLPLESLLLETDCPYLAPHPHRGQRNEPAYLPLIAARVAEIRGLGAEEIAEATTANARRLFGLEG